MSKWAVTVCIAVVFLLLNACTAQQQAVEKYPRKTGDTSGRKAGAAMLFYEQAEKDLDPGDSVIVIPPGAGQDE